MPIVFVFISVGISLFLWMYLLTYFMHIGAQKDFFLRARWAVLRWICIAWAILVIDMYIKAVSANQNTVSVFLSQIQWVLIPIIFFLGWLPFLWKRWKYLSLIPLGIAIGVYGVLYGGSYNEMVFGFFSETFQTPFYEEVGKWFQSLIYSYPAVMSPFVAIGFWFLENIVYFTEQFTWSQFLGRTLFSLPMHLFAGFFGFWCLFMIRPLWLGMIVGCIAAMSVHTLYNWSLGFSLILTLLIMISGYIFYGWSLENGWWKKLYDKASR